VCGSDGQLYPSHCELHRQACIKQVHIRVNRNGECGINNLHNLIKIRSPHLLPIYYRLFTIHPATTRRLVNNRRKIWSKWISIDQILIGLQLALFTLNIMSQV
jgi:hypothetical protein